MLNRVCAAMVVLLLLAVSAAAAEEIVLAGRGHTTVIVRGDTWKSAVWYDWGAHSILERFLGLVSGTQVPVVSASELTDPSRPRYETRIWVGRQPEVNRLFGPELDRLDDDGFLIAVRGHDVYLAGKHWWGDNWAAYDLLERFAGCRWYGPEPSFWKPEEEGKLGLFDIAAPRAKVTIPANARVVEEPTYKMRYFRFMPLHSFRLRYRDVFHHALVGIIPPAKYGKNHPEYFPLIDGKRRVPEQEGDYHFQPCVSNPEVVELVSSAAIEHFRKNPQAGSFSVGMNDTNAFCECPECMAEAPPEITDKPKRQAWAFFEFYNQVARRVEKEFPDKRLGCLAYAGLSELPAGSVKFHKTLVPYLTRDSAQLFDPAQAEEFRQTVDRWKSLSTRMGIYEYIYGGGFIVPRIFNRYLIGNVRERYGVEVDGFYAESYPNWGLDGPKYWLLARMLWNHRQDPQVLLDQYYRDLFGPAAKTMRAYFDYLEETWCTQTLPSPRSNYRWFLEPQQLEVFPPEKCDEAWKLLEVAQQQSSDPVVLRRIAYFRDTFALTCALSRRYAATARLDGLMQEDASKDGPARLPQRLAALDKWLEAPDPAIAFARVPKDALDMNVASDISRYDRHPVEAVAGIVEQIVSRELGADPGAKCAEVRSRIEALLSGKANENTASKATALTRTLAVDATLGVPHVTQPPAIDGQIASGEWPQKAYTGRFYRIHRLDLQEQTTTVFTAWKEGELYLGFDCQEAAGIVGAKVQDADRGGWREPAMLQDDCISLTFRKALGGFQSIRINANGALGFGEPAWEGVTRAAARKTATGWQAEMAISLDKLRLDPKDRARWTMAVARYTRQAAATAEAPSPAVEVSTLLPAPPGRGIIGYGNHPSLMTFTTGPRMIFED